MAYTRKRRSAKKKVSGSRCTKIGLNNCTRTRQNKRMCKVAKGKKRTFCRKRKNKRN